MESDMKYLWTTSHSRADEECLPKVIWWQFSTLQKMATDDPSQPRYDVSGKDGAEKVKIICLGDSAVGKSK